MLDVHRQGLQQQARVDTAGGVPGFLRDVLERASARETAARVAAGAEPQVIPRLLAGESLGTEMIAA